MLDDVGPIPGCVSFVVARDPTDADAVWITEVSDSKARHAASLEFLGARESIRKSMPLIADFGKMVETDVAGGIGLGHR